MNWLFADGSFIMNGIQAFCRMLIHSLWQGLLLTIVAGIVMLLTRKARAATRYTIISGLFMAFLAACCYTFIHEWSNGQANTGASLLTNTFSVAAVLHDYGISHLPAALAQYCSAHAAWIVGIWFAIFSIKCWQMGRAFGSIRRIKTSQYQNASAWWKNKMDALAQQLQIKRRVILVESGVINIPVVIGHLKPVIYIPIGLLANLPHDQVEAVLLHELAHIRRNDYLMNLFQNIAETVFFFNPGLLWVSTLLKQEREHCCDDMALAKTGKKKQLIQALISFKEHAVYGTTFTTAFAGRKNHLLQRVTRIIQNRNNALSIPEKVFLLISGLLFIGLLGAMGTKELPDKKIRSGREEKLPARVPVTVHVLADPIASAATLPAKAVVGQKRSAKRSPVVRAQKETAVRSASPKRRDNKEEAWSREQVQTDHKQAELHLQQVLKDQPQAAHAYRQAERDRAQAAFDRMQTARQREEVSRDRLLASENRRRAERDRDRANYDRHRSALNRLQAMNDHVQAQLNRNQAEKNRERAAKDRASITLPAM